MIVIVCPEYNENYILFYAYAKIDMWWRKRPSYKLNFFSEENMTFEMKSSFHAKSGKRNYFWRRSKVNGENEVRNLFSHKPIKVNDIMVRNSIVWYLKCLNLVVLRNFVSRNRKYILKRSLSETNGSGKNYTKLTLRGNCIEGEYLPLI